jgi:hypothetical protein
VTKHFNLLEAIRGEVTKRNLYQVSELEQDIAVASRTERAALSKRVMSALD